MNEVELIARAKEFATHAHEGQFRNDIHDNPYIVHPQEVANLVTTSGGSAAEIAAAWLHDTVEDTPTTIEDIRKQFGDEISEIVNGLTDFPEFEKLPLAERKAKQAERVRTESDSVKRVKLADQASNVAGIESMRSMPVTRGLEYAEGAKKIAEECKGISDYLDSVFQHRYEEAVKKLKSRAS